MKKLLAIALLVVTAITAMAKEGTFTGYAWKDEVKGVKLEEATEKVETTLTIDKAGVITAANLKFLVKKGDAWVDRADPKSEVSVDFKVTPVAATPGDNYVKGTSMFTVKTNDLMSFYAVAADKDGTTAFAFVEPETRYQYEAKLPANFDYNKKISELTIASGLLVPTVRTSSGGLIKPKDFSEIKDGNIFEMGYWGHVTTDYGVFKGLTADSTVKEFLTKAGIKFNGNKPVETPAKYGFSANGGWYGNYTAVAKFLVGKKVDSLKSLIDYKVPRYEKSVNAENYFGAVAGATRTVQNSVDTIAGATIRMSRENNSYQRALVAAGVIEEKDVIKGRF